MRSDAVLCAFERFDANLSAYPVAGILAVVGIAAFVFQGERNSLRNWLSWFRFLKTAAVNAIPFGTVADIDRLWIYEMMRLRVNVTADRSCAEPRHGRKTCRGF